MFHFLRAEFRNATSRARRPRRRPRTTFRPALESLETRNLLSLGAPVSYNIGTVSDGFVPNAAPINVVTADFNGDGKLDLAVIHKADNSVYILMNNGDGTFRPAIQTALGEAILGNAIAGDFNGDGKMDLFLPGGANQAIVLLGNGDATFQPRIDSSSFSVPGTYPRGWVVGDFNGDGKLDVAATLPSTSINSGGYTVLLGNGNGTFQAGLVGPMVLGYARWVATGDFNHDGILDLVTADGQQTNGHPGNAEMTILLGNGDGTFHLGGHYASPGLPSSDNLNPEDVVVGDLNLDGNLDVIVSNYDDNINVFLGKGDGTFQPAMGITPGEYPRDVAIADVNGDGKMDLVVTNVGIGAGGAEFAITGYKPGSVAVLLGNGDGTFQSPIQYYPFAYPGWTAIGDFNGDGAPDIAVTQVFDGHSVAVMLNNPLSNNQPPTIAIAPSANPSPAGSTTSLSVLGADDGGEANLTYAWGTVISPPAPVTFSGNGTNAAKNVTATFTKSGSYYFKMTATDASGLSVIGMVPVTVNLTLTSVTVAPSSASVAPYATQQFTATAKDASGTPLSPQPAFTWTVSGGGAINSNGLFTAGGTPGGPFTVTANSGGISGTASVTVTGIGKWTGLGTTSNWSDPANWSGNTVPGAGTTVTFDATSSKSAFVDAGFAGTIGALQINSGYTGSVSLSRNLTIQGSFTEAAGIFSAGSNSLVVAGDFMASGGAFNAGTSTVSFNGSSANQNVSAIGVNFFNVTYANSGGHSLNITGTLTANGTFTWLRTAGWIAGPSGSGNAAIECRGDVDDQNHGGTGTPYFTLDGTGDQTIKDTSGVNNYSGYPGGDFRGLTINKANGTVFLACDPLIYNGLSLLSGSVDTTSTNWWFVGGTSSANIISTAPGLNLGNITLAANIGTAMSTGLQMANLNLNGHSLTAPAALYVSGNWMGGASAFTANKGTVTFTAPSGTQTLDSGGSHFYNITHSGAGTLQLVNNLVVDGAFVNSGGPFDTNGKTVTYAVPPPHSRATDLTIGSDGKTRILWDQAGGAAGVWSVNGSTLTTNSPLYAILGSTARATAVGADGVTRVLWTSPGSAASLILFNADGTLRGSATFGPFSGWAALKVAVSADGKSRILWNNANGQMVVWSLDNSFNISSSPVYGPLSGWTAVNIATGVDGKVRVLWNNTDGTTALWLLNPDGTYNSSTAFGPITGWTAHDMAAGADGNTRILWTNTSGQMVIWSVNASFQVTAGTVYGPFSGWTALHLAAGSDGTVRMLWDHTSGTTAIWLLNPDGSFNSSTMFGPF